MLNDLINGAQKVLHEGEMYNGYVAIVYGSRSVDVVYMCGRLLRIDPSESTICYNYMRAEVIRQGKAWEISHTPSKSIQFREGLVYSYIPLAQVLYLW